ncbi:MAG: TIGR03960 family B12-binding radical SAM protein [Chloroflexota bacterium]|nr:TIGR03960 family B12-binding radical SAM protein [Chloroflexota bacterium]
MSVSHSTQESLQRRIERILATVVKPGRYVGGELNQTLKPWNSVRSHFALVFPDIYDLGQSNLGVALLYDILNQRDDVAAERAFAPWVDMEAAMREAGIPLFSLENKRALSNFEIVGVSLPYETVYTNFLNMLDLSNIPIFSKDRTREMPLVIAGGQAVYNPEPVTPFVDAFVLGEGEDAVLDVVNAYQSWEDQGGSREDLLIRLAEIPGVYIPYLYEVNYQDDGRIASIQPTHPSASIMIDKRIMAELPPPLTHFLVPNVEVVQERVSVEIMRGCTRGCRFCHAGMVNRPIRERPVDEILATLREGIRQTGYEEVSLLSLSSSDYSHIIPLINGLGELLREQQVNITLPSLRIESFSGEIMDALQDLSPGGGFTLAPEAGTERMRNIINKPISDAEFLDTVRAIFEHGWNTIKLYFMIGHPQETLEDVAAIAELAKETLQIGRRIVGGRARIHMGVSTFIPKPHTPFQWVAFDDPDSIHEKISLLHDRLHGSKVKMTWNDPLASQLEAWLSRGDRRIANVILHAWQNGARFDAWREHFNIENWQKAFKDCNLDPEFYGKRTRDLDEILPWDHINAGVKKNFLKQDYEWSKKGETRPDCRQQCYGCGILTSFNQLRLAHPNGGWKCP